MNLETVYHIRKRNFNQKSDDVDDHTNNMNINCIPTITQQLGQLEQVVDVNCFIKLPSKTTSDNTTTSNPSIITTKSSSSSFPYAYSSTDIQIEYQEEITKAFEENEKERNSNCSTDDLINKIRSVIKGVAIKILPKRKKLQNCNVNYHEDDNLKE